MSAAGGDLQQALQALFSAEVLVADWICAARTSASGAALQVLYVVPARARASHDWRPAAAEIFAAAGQAWQLVLVSSLPLAASGAIDVAALARLPVVNAAVAARAACVAADTLAVECAGVIVGSNLAHTPYHASQLLPKPSRHREVARKTHSEFTASASAAGPPAYIDGGALPDDPHAPATLLDMLEAAALRAAGALIAISADDREQRLEYAELLRRARCGAAQLLAAGLAPGTPVLLQFEDLVDFFEGFWACVAAGLMPVPSAALQAEQRGAAERLRAIWLSLDRATVLTQNSLSPALRSALSADGSPPRLLVLSRAEGVSDLPVARAASDDIALMMLTSGSTGTPKAVPLSHRNLISRGRGSQLTHGFSAALRSLNWMPLDHVAGLIYFHLRDVLLGATQVHVPTATVLRDPLRWLDLCEQYQAEVTFAPNLPLVSSTRAVQTSCGGAGI